MNTEAPYARRPRALCPEEYIPTESDKIQSTTVPLYLGKVSCYEEGGCNGPTDEGGRVRIAIMTLPFIAIPRRPPRSAALATTGRQCPTGWNCQVLRGHAGGR